MSDAPFQVPPAATPTAIGGAEGMPRRRGPIIVALIGTLLLTATVLGYYFYYPSKVGPAQPIAFSHRFHAGEKGISCVLCHAGAFDSARAGIPELETCMLCHRRIIVSYPEIEKLRHHYFSGEPVVWNRVNWVPEFVYFDHSMHSRRGIDCGQCHGDVRQMDRIEAYQDFSASMGFCVQCHRDNDVSHDCYTCHR